MKGQTSIIYGAHFSHAGLHKIRYNLRHEWIELEHVQNFISYKFFVLGLIEPRNKYMDIKGKETRNKRKSHTRSDSFARE